MAMGTAWGGRGWGHRGVRDGDGALGLSRVPAHLEALQELGQVSLQLRTVGHEHAVLVQHVVRQEVHEGELVEGQGGSAPTGTPQPSPESPTHLLPCKPGPGAQEPRQLLQLLGQLLQVRRLQLLLHGAGGHSSGGLLPPASPNPGASPSPPDRHVPQRTPPCRGTAPGAGGDPAPHNPQGALTKSGL